MDYKIALSVIRDAIVEYNAQEPEDRRLSISEDTVLFNWKNGLDSLGIATLCIFVEEMLVERLDMDMNVMDEAANRIDEHPFRNIKSFAQFLAGVC